MSTVSISRRAALAAVLGIAIGGTRAAAQADDLSGIPNVNQLTEQERTTYRRRLQDATSDQQRAQIREEARVQAQQRAQLHQGSGQGSGSGQGAGGGQGRGGGQGAAAAGAVVARAAVAAATR